MPQTNQGKIVRKVILWGGTGHAKVLHQIFQYFDWELVAVFDNDTSVGSPFKGVPLYHGVEGFRKWKVEHDNEEVWFLVAIGGARGYDRVTIQRFLEDQRLKPCIAVHPTAFVAEDTRIKAGSQILAHAALCSEAELGRSCILNTGSSVDHECYLGDGVHIGPGAVLAGLVTVGDYSFVGSGAVVLPRINIGENVIVGAGSVVTKDVEDGKVVYGNPARVIRENTQNAVAVSPSSGVRVQS